MLFDIGRQNPELTGIARLAAESPVLEAKQRVEYFEIETRSFVGRCSGTRMPFVWTVNPYRGCEFGCKYCYARYAHEFMELRDPQQFERKIYAKRFDPAAFRAELAKVKPGQSVWIGTATDPYQPAERRYGITRQILEVIANERDLTIGVTTKSDLVARDAGLMRTISQRNLIHINPDDHDDGRKARATGGTDGAAARPAVAGGAGAGRCRHRRDGARESGDAVPHR